MRSIAVITSVLAICLFSLGCGEGVANPFAGSQWDVGSNHVSFSHGVAQWDTVHNSLKLKFNLLSGTTYPDAVVEVANVTTLAVNDPREASVTISISQGMTYETITGDADASATITFSRLDLTTLGAASGTITGQLKRVEDPSEPPAVFTAGFDSAPITY